MWRVEGHADGQGYGARLEGSNRDPGGGPGSPSLLEGAAGSAAHRQGRTP